MNTLALKLRGQNVLVQYACAHSVTLNCYSERVQHGVSVCNGAVHRGARQLDASHELEREHRADYLCAAQCNANTSVCSCSLKHVKCELIRVVDWAHRRLDAPVDEREH